MLKAGDLVRVIDKEKSRFYPSALRTREQEDRLEVFNEPEKIDFICKLLEKRISTDKCCGITLITEYLVLEDLMNKKIYLYKEEEVKLFWRARRF